MMKRTAMQLRRQPGVTARPWSQWDNFRKMQKLVATGSYRPPEWYYAMRVAPPPHRAYKDPTRRVPLEAPHQEVQERLAKDHPDVAAIGRRVFNNFWMEKPVEKMAHQYEMLRAQGQSKQEAYATVSEECRKVPALAHVPASWCPAPAPVPHPTKKRLPTVHFILIAHHLLETRK